MVMVDLQAVDMLHVGAMAPEVVVEGFMGCDPEMELVAPRTLSTLVWTGGGGSGSRCGVGGGGPRRGDRGPRVSGLGHLSIGCSGELGPHWGGGGLN